MNKNKNGKLSQNKTEGYIFFFTIMIFVWNNVKEKNIISDLMRKKKDLN